jgi:SAM-dependent methyltransferase
LHVPSIRVLIPFQPSSQLAPRSDTAEQVARSWQPLAGEVQVLEAGLLRTELRRGNADVIVVHDAGFQAPTSELNGVLEPFRSRSADAVFARVHSSGLRKPNDWGSLALAGLAKWLHQVPLSAPFSPLRAFSGEALRSLSLSPEGEGLDAELLSKLSAQHCRLTEVEVHASGSTEFARPWSSQWEQAKAMFRYATTHNDADNLHEGYNTLLRMDIARNYNRWLGQKFRRYLGRRVLEVGAGIGTITQELEPGLDLLIALEVEPFYVARLKNLFRDKPHVRPHLSDVSSTSWDALVPEKLDTIVLSNVLEHIDDDARAVRDFRRVLPDGGRLLVLVPALPSLYGALDEAVGHHRRYSREGLQQVLENNGFVVESVEFLNAVGIPGWFLNGRLFRRRAVPPLQLRIFDVLAPYLAKAESGVALPVGMSLFAVAKAKPAVLGL